MKEAQQKVVDALIKTNNNRSAAARHLGLSRHALYNLMHRIPIDWDTEHPVINPFQDTDE